MRDVAGQATSVWQDRYAHRSGIDDTTGQASRRDGLHYALDMRLARESPQVAFERYADDGAPRTLKERMSAELRSWRLHC